MIIRIEPYYCPHCRKFKKRSEVYMSYGYKSLGGGIGVEGTPPFCDGCDTAVDEVKPKIRNAIIKLMESNLCDWDLKEENAVQDVEVESVRAEHEIVYCKDCKYSYTGNYFTNYACRLEGDNDQGLPNCINPANGFCYRGERRK